MIKNVSFIIPIYNEEKLHNLKVGSNGLKNTVNCD